MGLFLHGTEKATLLILYNQDDNITSTLLILYNQGDNITCVYLDYIASARAQRRRSPALRP